MSAHQLKTWGVIKVTGPEAAAFLHSQLTNSIENMPEHLMRMAGFCSAKGRLQGTFFVVRNGEDVYLVCKRDTIDALVKRLTLFKLRRKCELSNASGQVAVEFIEDTGAEPMSVQKADTKVVCSIRPSPRTGKTVGFALHPGNLPESENADQQFDAELQALGIAFVCADTVEQFVPQAVNFDLVGGIHFEKGCYPGQEVVARSHYIGKVKRRAFLATIPEILEVKPGSDVWQTGKTNEPAGTVVTACQHEGNTLLMVELVAVQATENDASYSLESGESDNTFTVSQPPYDVFEKGDRFA
ncbi:MAG: folate-binding protein [Limnobacter sp.]|nr:folate-binding protein [Limnobacter sp.]